MALELIVVEGLLVLVLACLGFAHFSSLKIFWVAGFLLLMLTGFLVITNDGVILNHYYDIDGVYSSTVLAADSGAGFVFSNLCLWGGLVLLAWSVLFSSMLQASGEVRRAFVWD
jgi:hypothetical protein